jgi:hypothetical protein
MSADYYTFEATEYGDYAVYAWGTYERSSVLAGQTKKRFLGARATTAEVRKDFPKAVERGAEMEPQVSLAHLPDENTPVAGGAYPDDWSD